MKRLKGFIIILLSCIFICCENQKYDLIDSGDSAGSYAAELRSIGFQNIKSDMAAVWDYAYDEYGMSVMCACDDTRLDALREIINDNQGLFPESIRGPKLSSNNSCLADVFLTDCTSNNSSDFVNYAQNIVLNDLVSEGFISDEEKNLLSGIIDDIVGDGEFNQAEYINQWEALGPNQQTNNRISLILVATSSAAFDYMTSHPNDFPDPPSAIIPHITAGIVSAGLSLVVQCTWDTIDDYGLDGEGLTRGMAMAGMGGFVAAL